MIALDKKRMIGQFGYKINLCPVFMVSTKVFVLVGDLGFTFENPDLVHI